jgi:hypothetical protein
MPQSWGGGAGETTLPTPNAVMPPYDTHNHPRANLNTSSQSYVGQKAHNNMLDPVGGWGGGRRNTPPPTQSAVMPHHNTHNHPRAMFKTKQ